MVYLGLQPLSGRNTQPSIHSRIGVGLGCVGLGRRGLLGQQTVKEAGQNISALRRGGLGGRADRSHWDGRLGARGGERRAARASGSGTWHGVRDRAARGLVGRACGAAALPGRRPLVASGLPSNESCLLITRAYSAAAVGVVGAGTVVMAGAGPSLPALMGLPSNSSCFLRNSCSSSTMRSTSAAACMHQHRRHT